VNDTRATAFDPPYDRLRALPRAVWLPTLVAAVGERRARLHDAQRWLAALSDGALPPADADFGDVQAATPLRTVVGALALPPLARGTPALAEQIVRTLLWHLDHALDLQPRLARVQAIAQVTQEFQSTWQLETQGLEADLALLRDLSGGAHLRWDELRGRLRSREWQAARRAAERLEALPQIDALLRRLGRREWSTQVRPARATETSTRPQRAPMRAVTTRLPGAPGEISGIRFDSRIEHMLPSEALLLRHPVGQRLWRARQAEGRLLAHATEAVVVDWRPDPHGRTRDAASAAPHSLERGPFVLCLDTSGSMAGAPENIAKAVAIAALRAAHAQQRACRLLAFGGPGEIIERDLGGANSGLASVLDLMGQAFDGGTDVQAPIQRALECIADAAWTGADLLIVSDGEFGCRRATLDGLDHARRELGLHVQGVLVGDRETMGMLEVCDDIVWLRDWRRHSDDGGDAQAGSPVHTKSLTALYFPNALSERAARHHNKGSA
jgi:uncharacterized protein with von Willebrand factor type A (vWA) domain